MLLAKHFTEPTQNIFYTSPIIVEHKETTFLEGVFIVKM